MNKEAHIKELAQRLFDYIAPWDREYNTVDDIADDMENNPVAVIEYLLDQLEA